MQPITADELSNLRALRAAAQTDLRMAAATDHILCRLQQTNPAVDLSKAIVRVKEAVHQFNQEKDNLWRKTNEQIEQARKQGVPVPDLEQELARIAGN